MKQKNHPHQPQHGSKGASGRVGFLSAKSKAMFATVPTTVGMAICGHTTEPNYHKYSLPTHDQIQALAKAATRKYWSALGASQPKARKRSAANSPGVAREACKATRS